MKTLYIVVDNGCVKFVSTDSADIFNSNLEVSVIYLDDQNAEEDALEHFHIASKLPRVW